MSYRNAQYICHDRFGDGNTCKKVTDLGLAGLPKGFGPFIDPRNLIPQSPQSRVRLLADGREIVV